MFTVKSSHGYYTGEAPNGCPMWSTNKNNARLFRLRDDADDIVDSWGGEIVSEVPEHDLVDGFPRSDIW